MKTKIDNFPIIFFKKQAAEIKHQNPYGQVTVAMHVADVLLHAISSGKSSNECNNQRDSIHASPLMERLAVIYAITYNNYHMYIVYVSICFAEAYKSVLCPINND